ncbi:hypothetical protein TCAL_17262 [Tigriopus californicus]|uniref:Uncharacterized protein n=1 Tax=Tigriopus californicus TaxID=6832 RepID=A0A553NZN2_TIGCA|nr:hypothetical protein TCAL_17262 [Tigriopus californicus]
MASSMYNKDLFRQHSYDYGSTSGYVTTINSVMAGNEAQQGADTHERGCCGTRGRGEKCTAAKAKSFMKMFFAQLFSHVGLCALVVGYAIMGAFIFVYLEKANELKTRETVQDTKKNTWINSITSQACCVFPPFWYFISIS